MAQDPDAPPIEPGPEQAHSWLVDELSKPEYTQARPSLIDRVGQAIADWFQSLVVPGEGTLSAWLLVFAVVVVVALVIGAVAVWGRPRRSRTARSGPGLFGDDDQRPGHALLADARSAAALGDWDAAVLDAFRATARRFDERALIDLTPGTTARAFQQAAARVLPQHTEILAEVAARFDDVRYLHGHADQDDAERSLRLASLVDDEAAVTSVGARQT